MQFITPWTAQDDAIAVKDAFRCPPHDDRAGGGTYQVAVPSEHMLFERINASGLG